MVSARLFSVWTLLDFSLADFSVLGQHKVKTIGRGFFFPFFHCAQQVSTHIKTQRLQVLHGTAQLLYWQTAAWLSRMGSWSLKHAKSFAMMVLRWGVFLFKVLPYFLFLTQRKTAIGENGIGQLVICPNCWTTNKVKDKNCKIYIYIYILETFFSLTSPHWHGYWILEMRRSKAQM